MRVGMRSASGGAGRGGDLDGRVLGEGGPSTIPPGGRRKFIQTVSFMPRSAVIVGSVPIVVASDGLREGASQRRAYQTHESNVPTSWRDTLLP